MNAPVRLIFRGEALDGFRDADVRRSLGDQLKLDDARLAHLFSGRRVVLKPSIDAESARRRVAQFAVLGARLHIEAAVETDATAAPRTAWLPAAPPTMLMTPPAGARTLLAAATAQDTITCPNCGEVQPQAVFCRGCVTNMPMAVAARLDIEAQALAAREAHRQLQRDTRLASRPVAAAAAIFGLSLDGRLARRPYATGSAGAMAVLALMAMFALQRPGALRSVFAGLVMVAALLFTVRLTVLRCHDFNRSGWWSLLTVVPYLGVVASVVVSVIPGSDDDNDHGPPPDPGHWLPLLLASGVLALALLASSSAALRAYERGLEAPPTAAPAPAPAEAG
jgi:uncharacterized membrane protein YhaH (DUF805 family)